MIEPLRRQFSHNENRVAWQYAAPEVTDHCRFDYLANRHRHHFPCRCCRVPSMADRGCLADWKSLADWKPLADWASLADWGCLADWVCLADWKSPSDWAFRAQLADDISSLY